MIKISKEYPPAHSKYIVKRNENLFTATPWWVQTIMDGSEIEPVYILKEDEWCETSNYT